MKKTHINIRLLAILGKVLRMTNQEICQKTGLAVATWYRIQRAPGKITVQQLLALANGLRIPVGRFFSPDGYDYIGKRGDYVMDEGYQECRYDDVAVRKTIGPGTGITWKAAADAIGLNWTRAEPVLLSSSRLPLDSYMQFCKAFGFDPFGFLVDPNDGGTNQPEKKRTGGADGRRNAMEISNLRSRIESMQACIEVLKRKCKELEDAYRKLESRMSVSYDIHHFKDSSIAIAADPSSEEEEE